MRFTLALIASVLLVSIDVEGQVLGAAQNVPFPLAANLATGGGNVVVSPDGSWIAARAANAATADVIVLLVDANGVVTSTQSIVFPQGVNVDPSSPALVMSEDGRFVAVFGDGGPGDLVIIRMVSPGLFAAAAVSHPGGGPIAVGSRPVISPRGDYVMTLGPGGVNDLVITPIVVDPGGSDQLGTPFSVAFPAGNDLPLVSGVQPVVTCNGRAIVVAGSAPGGDLVVVTVDGAVTPAGTTATNVAFPNGGQLANPASPIAVSPDGRWCAAYGSPTLGDLVVVPLGANGAPGLPQAVLFPANNNALSPLTPLALGAAGD